MTTKTQTKRMKQVHSDVVALVDSPLYAYRIETKGQVVIGEGSYDAHILFIGEAPGKNEAATGKPFCGASGKVLDQLLEGIGLDRKTVYITNIVKDRPPENRDPKPEEIELYAPFMDRQIEIIQPKVIATLGRFAMEYVMKRYGLEDKLEPISKAHGKTYKAQMRYGLVYIMPLYHPAVAVYNRNKFGMLLEDFQTVQTYA